MAVRHGSLKKVLYRDSERLRRKILRKIFGPTKEDNVFGELKRTRSRMG
jgi:hypothetical protein